MGIGVHEYLMQAAYFAPRGKSRIVELGRSIAQRYLDPLDKLIGLVGSAGAGKSLLIRGIFPGLELTNDDNGINIRPLPLLHDAERGHFRSHSYHVDIRFETAFTQPYIIAEAVKKAIAQGRRVILEHFELLYPVLQINAEVLIGIGEEVIVTRPGVFGPFPDKLAAIVFNSLKYRKMAHTAEDLTAMVLAEKGIQKPDWHNDIKHGFILEFEEKPDIDLDEVEKKVQELIAKKIPITYCDEGNISIGTDRWACTGPRLHAANSGDIEGFRLLKEFKWNPIEAVYILAGFVGDDYLWNIEDDSPASFALLHAPSAKMV